MIKQQQEFQERPISSFVEQAKKAGIPDYEIYNKLNNEKSFVAFQERADKEKIPKVEQKKLISEKYGLKIEEPRTFRQSALRATMGLFPYIGEKLGVRSIEEMGNIPGNIMSALESLPQNIANAPGRFINSQLSYDALPESVAQGMPEGFDTGAYHSDFVPELKPNQVGIFGQESPEDIMAKNISEQDKSKTAFGQLLDRAVYGGASGSVGGPIGSALGAGLGALDYIEEQLGFSERSRSMLPLAIGRAKPPTISGELQIPTNRGKLPPPLPERTFLDKAKSKVINSSTDLAAKVLAKNPKNINFQALEDLSKAGFDLSEVPVQAYTTGGIPNWFEGASSNSMIGAGDFNDLVDKFSGKMTNKLESLLDSYPIEKIDDIVHARDLGEPQWNNYIRNTLESVAPQLDLTRQDISEIGTDFAKITTDLLGEQARIAYDTAKITDSDVLSQKMPQFLELQDTIKNTRNTLKSTGYQHETRQKALKILDEIETLFEEVKQPTELFEQYPYKEKPKQYKAIKFENIRKNLQDLNKKINYEDRDIFNLIEPVATKFRQIINEVGEKNPNLKGLIEGNKLFSKKSKFSKEPVVKALSKMKPEQAFNYLKKPSVLKDLKRVMLENDNIKDYDSIRSAVLGDVLRKVYEADSPSDLVKGINHRTIQEVRQLQEFFPEYPNLAEGLIREHQKALKFSTKEEVDKSNIRNDLMDYALLGDLPVKTLQKMDTPKGIRIVKDTLKDTEQGIKMYRTLERKKVEQILYDGTHKQEISIQDIPKILDKQKNYDVLQELLPKESFEQLKRISRVIENFDKGKKIGSPVKGTLGKAMSILPAMELANIPLSMVGAATFYGVPITTTLSLYGMSKILMSKNFRDKYVENIKKQHKKNLMMYPVDRIENSTND